MNDKRLLAEFKRAKKGASVAAIDRAAKRLGVEFAPDYIAFMRESNGGEGPFGKEGYMRLWRVEELVSSNEGYETAEYFPRWVFLGSNGGGEAVAMSKASPVVFAL